MEEKVKPKKQWGLVVVCALLLVAACSGCRAEHQADKAVSKKEVQKITLATSKNIWCALSLIAMDQGLFNAEGLEVDVQYLQSGRYCLDAVLSGSAHFGNIVDPNIAFLGFTGNSSVIVIGSIVESSDSSAIVTRKSSGISKGADLRNKKLALAPGTTSDVFANRFIEKYGLKPGRDVEIVKVQPAAMQGALLSKGVDAISIWQPFVYNISRALGTDALVLKDASIYTGYELISIRKDWLIKNEATVRAFLRANLAAEKFIQSQPEKSKAIIARMINLDEAVVDTVWGEFKFKLTMDRRRMVDEVAQIGRWINETQEGYIGKGIPEYGIYFNDSFVRSLLKGNNP